MENRNGLCVDFAGDQALEMLDRQRRNGIRSRTPGAEKAYDTSDFIADLRTRGITPHAAQNQKRRRSAIDQRTARKLLPQPAPAQGWRRPPLERAASREASRGPAER